MFLAGNDSTGHAWLVSVPGSTSIGREMHSTHSMYGARHLLHGRDGRHVAARRRLHDQRFLDHLVAARRRLVAGALERRLREEVQKSA